MRFYLTRSQLSWGYTATWPPQLNFSVIQQHGVAQTFPTRRVTMSIAERYSQSLMGRWCRSARAVTVLLSVAIPVAGRAERAAAQGTVTGSTPAPMPSGPLASVTAMPPFLRTNPTDRTPPAARGPASDPPPCADTGNAPAAAFRGPPYKDPVVGLSSVFHLGANLGAPTVQVLVPVRYPPALQASGTQGTVTIHYWVNPSGCAEPASFQVKQASDSGMAVAVRDAVRRMHFVERGPSGTMLWASVEQVFTFRITP